MAKLIELKKDQQPTARLSLGRDYVSDIAVLRGFMNRVVLAFAFVAVLPMLACHHAGVAQAQNDPLNNSFKPTQDCSPSDYPTYIAQSGDMIKLQQQSGSPSGVYGASPCIVVYGFPNEFVDWQLHIQGQASGTNAIQVSVSNLVKSTGPGGNYTITSQLPTTVIYREYYQDIPSGDLASSGFGFYNVAGWYPDALVPQVDPYYNQTTNAFPMNVPAGDNQSVWIDQLIPEAAASGWYAGTVTITNGSTTIATLPVLLGVWSWPTAEGGKMPTQPTLPFIDSGGVGYESLCRQQYLSTSNCGGYAAAGGSDSNGDNYMAADMWQMLLDHRLNDSYPHTYPDSGSFSLYNNYYSYLYNGTGVTRGGFTVNPILGAKVSMGDLIASGSGLSFGGGGNATSVMPNWLNNFKAQGWYASNESGGQPALYWYGADEPTASALANLVTNASFERTATNPIVPIVVTTNFENTSAVTGAQNAVDTMVVAIQCMDTEYQYSCNNTTSIPGNRRAEYNSWLAGTGCVGCPTRHVWGYLACGSSGTCNNGFKGNLSYVSYDVDAYPVNNRMEEWEVYHNQESGDLYYLFDGCFYTECGGRVSVTSGSTTLSWSSGPLFSSALAGSTIVVNNSVYATIASCSSTTSCTLSAAYSGSSGTYGYDDPWLSVYEYGNTGDGDLLYPGITRMFGMNYPIWCPSIRLKLMRDSMQDYEYLHLLTAVGKGSTVATQVATWLTNSAKYNPFPYPCPTSATCPSLGGATYTGDLPDARYNLGNAIHQLTFGSALQPPPSLTGTLQ